MLRYFEMADKDRPLYAFGVQVDIFFDTLTLRENRNGTLYDTSIAEVSSGWKSDVDSHQNGISFSPAFSSEI